MDFIPLAIWAIGIAFIGSYEMKIYYSLGWKQEKIDKKLLFGGKVWAVGCGIFLILGILS